MTSFFAVNLVKRAIRKFTDGQKVKVGHAGTLDPLATGLLILCTGKMTREIHSFQAREKRYSGTFRLGASTPSYDLETEIDQTCPTDHLGASDIVACAGGFLGDQEMIPPIHSAIKVNGKRAYHLARQGHMPELKAKTVTIQSLSVDPCHLPDVHFEVVCSKGTYIRSLAHEFGKRMGVLAHLTALRRESIGEFQATEAFVLDELTALLRANHKISQTIE